MKEFLWVLAKAAKEVGLMIFTFVTSALYGLVCALVSMRVVDFFCESQLFKPDNLAIFALVLTVVFYIYPLSEEKEKGREFYG